MAASKNTLFNLNYIISLLNIFKFIYLPDTCLEQCEDQRAGESGPGAVGVKGFAQRPENNIVMLTWLPAGFKPTIFHTDGLIGGWYCCHTPPEMPV